MTDLNCTKKCILPWIHINGESSGDMFLCCRADQSTGKVGNFNQIPLKEIWSGEEYTKIRKQMIDGIEPEPCKICYKTERLGGESKRMKENKLWKEHSHLTESEYVDYYIPYIDIRFNNICNLKCRSCRPLHSHLIAQEHIKMGESIPHEIVLKSNPESLAKDLDILAPQIEEIYFCGGEPLLMEEHYDLINKLEAVGNYDARLRYSTNLTKLEYKNHNILEQWKKFKNVSIHASLDGIGTKLEYIRHGTKWNKVVENLELLKANNIDIKISPTVSIFNVLDLDEICSYYIDNGFITENDLGITVLEGPYYYSVQTLHPTLKKVATEKIKLFIGKYNMTEDTTKRFTHLINYMNETDTFSETREQFKLITEKLDNFRNENFNKTFPELRLQYG